MWSVINLLDNNDTLCGFSPEINELKMLSKYQVDENQLSSAEKMLACTRRSVTQYVIKHPKGLISSVINKKGGATLFLPTDLESTLENPLSHFELKIDLKLPTCAIFTWLIAAGAAAIAVELLRPFVVFSPTSSSATTSFEQRSTEKKSTITASVGGSGTPIQLVGSSNAMFKPTGQNIDIA
ncbi:hypothetical protein CR513_61852, partial [Mucuna pruriens]